MVKLDQIRHNLAEKGYLMTDEQIVLNLAKMMEEIAGEPRTYYKEGSWERQPGEKGKYECSNLNVNIV